MSLTNGHDCLKSDVMDSFTAPTPLNEGPRLPMEWEMTEYITASLIRAPLGAAACIESTWCNNVKAQCLGVFSFKLEQGYNNLLDHRL